MPFLDEHDQPLTRIFLVQRGPRSFQLCEPFWFVEKGRPLSEKILVPAHDLDTPAVGGNQTDLTSVPPALWGLIASYGRQTAPALLHDHLSADARGREASAGIWIRTEADRLFRTALIEADISATRAALMWAAVTVAKFWELRRWQGTAMAIHLVLGVLLAYTVVAGVCGALPGATWSPGLLLLLLAPGMSWALWGRSRWAMVLLGHAGAILLPFGIIGWLGQMVLLLLEGIGWLATARRSPTPRLGPTILTPGEPEVD